MSSNEPIQLEDDNEFINCRCGTSYPPEEVHECEEYYNSDDDHGSLF